MDENTSVVDGAPVGDGKSSDEILAEIEAAQAKQLEPKSSDDKSDGSELSETQPVSQRQQEPTDKPIEQEEDLSPSEPQAAPQGKDKADEVDEWMRKKGFKSSRDMAKSLRHLERKLHEKAKAMPRHEDQPNYGYQPGYRQAPVTPTVEELARRYNLPPEDFERVMPLINDAADFKIRSGVQPLLNELNALKKEMARGREMDNLKEDPAFHNREVLKEMYQIIEEEPSILEREPEPYNYAFNKALSNMGRRIIEGRAPTNDDIDETRTGIPTTPPPLGRGAASGSKGTPMRSRPNKMTQERFNSLSSADMEKYLASRGLVRNEW